MTSDNDTGGAAAIPVFIADNDTNGTAASFITNNDNSGTVVTTDFSDAANCCCMVGTIPFFNLEICSYDDAIAKIMNPFFDPQFEFLSFLLD